MVRKKLTITECPVRKYPNRSLLLLFSILFQGPTRNENAAASKEILNRVYLPSSVEFPYANFVLMWQGSKSGSEMEVTWEDQQNINTFSRLNNRFHDLHDEIKSAKVLFHSILFLCESRVFRLYFVSLHP